MDTGARNAVMGDQDLPTNLPVTKVPEEVLTEEKKMAKYSKSEEFKRLATFMQERIKFYQRFLPNGQQVEGSPLQVGMPQGVAANELGSYWMAACMVIKEFEDVLNSYERAQEAVKDAGREN